MPIHFGLKIIEGKRGLKLTRDNYAVVSNKNSLMKFSRDIYADEDGKFYSEEWCEQQLEDCLKNYDLNMEFFSLLDEEEFEDVIKTFLHKNNGFKEVTDLNLYENKPGYYLMVLDEYKQLYIGTTTDIKKRIRQHWTKSKPFDRLLFPMGNIESSLLSVDSFCALDTTRIYAYESKKLYNKEDYFIKQIPPKFLCNRLAGGKVTNGFLQAILMMKARDLTKLK